MVVNHTYKIQNTIEFIYLVAKTCVATPVRTAFFWQRLWIHEFRSGLTHHDDPNLIRGHPTNSFHTNTCSQILHAQPSNRCKTTRLSCPSSANFKKHQLVKSILNILKQKTGFGEFKCIFESFWEFEQHINQYCSHPPQYSHHSVGTSSLDNC